MRVSIPVAGLIGFFERSGGGTYGANRISLFMATNDWRITASNANAQTTPFNNTTIIASAPTTGAYIDIVWTWTGTNAANGLKLYVNGALLAQATAGGSLANPLDAMLTEFISIGGVNGLDTVRYYFNECVVWDSVIDPTSVALVSGTGSLNGASRTSFVDAAAFDGSLNTDPGIANVRNGTGYTIAGVAKTGTAVIPSLANTKIGVAGDGGTGTYDGSDRWSVPAIANVLASAPSYLENGVSRTGTFDVSAAYTDPGVANVRAGITYMYENVLKTGLFTLPAPAGVGSLPMLRQAFNLLTRLHSRAATLKRLGSPDETTACRITPSNYFRNHEGPSHTIVHGREFIIPRDTIVAPFDPILKRGDRIVDSTFGTLTIDEITEINDMGGAIMGYRVRTE